jgi:hypothetical protein
MPIIRSSITAVAASGLPLERSGSSAVARGRSGCDNRTDHDQQHVVGTDSSAVGRGRSGFYGKPEAAAAVDMLLMMGMRMSETC